MSEPPLQLVSGTVSFFADSKASKTITNFINGEDACIQVTVTWCDKEIGQQLWEIIGISRAE